MVKLLKVENDFKAWPVHNGDEVFVNGIFEFNITKMIGYIQENPDHFILEEVEVCDFFIELSSINASHVDSVDVSKPVIIAEIAPGRFNLIDGNHRMEKARRMGIKKILAYKLNPAQHTRFLTICGKGLKENINNPMIQFVGYSYRGTVCVKCGRVYCDDCADPTKSTPCRKCGEGLKPAIRVFVNQAANIKS